MQRSGQRVAGFNSFIHSLGSRDESAKDFQLFFFSSSSFLVKNLDDLEPPKVVYSK